VTGLENYLLDSTVQFENNFTKLFSNLTHEMKFPQVKFLRSIIHNPVTYGSIKFSM